MKMYDIIDEGDALKGISGWALDKAKGALSNLDPFFRRGYSKTSDEAAAELARETNKIAKDNAKQVIKNRLEAGKLEREAAKLTGRAGEAHPTLQTKVITKVKGKNTEKMVPATKKDLEKDAAQLRSNADDLEAKSTVVDVPQPDKYRAGQHVTQATLGGGTGLGLGTEIFADDPENARAEIGRTVRGSLAQVPALFGIDGKDDEEDSQAATIPDAPKNESTSEILKLAGLRPVTERDNIAGIIRPKEIVALHESTHLDECGIMPSAPNQTASLSINATAGNGQEVANMLAAIMNLAGVKPVSSDMLGTSAMPPMPIVKAIDIISRGDSDSMNGGHHDHDDKETLTGSMEEEYGNTPENPTDVPDLDTNAHAHQPNAVDVGDRMDGTMPKGFPQVTQESLLQAYNQFKNGQ